ncbi:MAG: hypothetical protein WD845_13680, partial [Pirellulales bacterium]
MPLHRRTLWTSIGLALWLAVLSGAVVRPAARADPPDEQHLAELRQQGLYEQAEKYCADRLAEEGLPADERTALAIELSRTYAAHAAQSPVAARPALWQAARQTADDFAARYPREPRLPLLRMQAALAALAEGESVREEAELGGNPHAELAAARTALRRAIKQLQDLHEAITVELRQRNRGARQVSTEGLSPAELSSLELHARYQLARALREQGLCYQADSADRLNSLGQSVELLAAIAQHEMTPQLAGNVRIDEIVCLRLIGNYGAAEKKLAQANRDQ